MKLPWSEIEVDIPVSVSEVSRIPFIRIDDVKNPDDFRDWLYGATLPNPDSAFLIDYQQYLFEKQNGHTNYWD